MLGGDVEPTRGAVALWEAVTEFLLFQGLAVVPAAVRMIDSGPLVAWRCKNCGASGQCKLGKVKWEHAKFRASLQCPWNTGAVVVRKVKGVE